MAAASIPYIGVFSGNERLVGVMVACNVQFLVVGGVAVRFYAPARDADDLDLWVDSSAANMQALQAALFAAGHELLEIRITGRPTVLPLRGFGAYADIVLWPERDFGAEWDAGKPALLGPHPVRVASIELLLLLKRESNRDQDRSDAALLEKVRAAM